MTRESWKQVPGGERTALIHRHYFTMFRGFHDPNLQTTPQHMIFMIYRIILDSLRASISLLIAAPTNVSIFCMDTLFRQLRSNHSPHSHSWRGKYATGTFCFTTTVARPITDKNCLGQGCFSCRNFLYLHHFWLVTSLFLLGKKGVCINLIYSFLSCALSLLYASRCDGDGVTVLESMYPRTSPASCYPDPLHLGCPFSAVL